MCIKPSPFFSGKINLLPRNEFRSTAFQLPQLQDATQVAPEYQIQIAIFQFGVTYFQQQAMLLIST
jgi:hypothetical protein